MQGLGNLYIVSAPSGAGKTSLVDEIIRGIDRVAISVSYTTRARRTEEKNGIDYFFVTQEEFTSMLEQGMFLEHAKVFENYYGTSRAWVEERLANGTDVILIIDWQGAFKVMEAVPCISIMVIPPSLQELEHRLLARNQDSKEAIELRLSQAKNDVRQHDKYDYLVLNKEFSTAVEEIKHIILANRLKTKVQQNRLKTTLENILK